MKKLTTLTLFCAILMMAYGANAQYNRGDLTFNAGFSFGLIGYGWGYGSHSGGFVPLTANLEYSLDDRFAIGPYVGYFSRSYKSASYTDRFSVVSFGARGTFHATPQINEWFDSSIDESKIDIYGTLLLGYEIYSWNYDDAWGNDYIYNHSSGRFILGPVLGIRYNFN
ncbi:hypothetical protein, partial [Cesiribacter andamanensis]|uniref:hypothetical protein n=1 Tax=Cesiribacter andamanensis TaxID=649507 RepID=UPI00058D8399